MNVESKNSRFQNDLDALAAVGLTYVQDYPMDGVETAWLPDADPSTPQDAAGISVSEETDEDTGETRLVYTVVDSDGAGNGGVHYRLRDAIAEFRRLA